MIYVCIQIVKAIVYFLIEIKRNYFKKQDERYEEVSETYLLRQSLPIYGTNLLTMPMTQIPIILLSNFSGQKQVAFFSVGSKLSIPLSLIAVNLMSAVYPILARLYKQNKELFNDRFRKLFLLLSFGGIIFCLIFSLFSKEIVEIFFGNKYKEATPALSIMLWVTLNSIIHSFLGIIFIAADREMD